MLIHIRHYNKEFLIQNIKKLNDDAIMEQIPHRFTQQYYIVEKSEYLKAISLLKMFNYQVTESRCRAFISISNNEIKLNYFQSDLPDIFWKYACNIGDGYLIFPEKLFNKIKFLLNYYFIEYY